jgi:hypothetical protein
LNGKVAASGLENRDQQPWGYVALTTRHLYPQKLALTSPKCGGCSVGIVRLRIKATDFLVSVAMFTFTGHMLDKLQALNKGYIS